MRWRSSGLGCSSPLGWLCAATKPAPPATSTARKHDLGIHRGARHAAPEQGDELHDAQLGVQHQDHELLLVGLDRGEVRRQHRGHRGGIPGIAQLASLHPGSTGLRHQGAGLGARDFEPRDRDEAVPRRRLRGGGLGRMRPVTSHATGRFSVHPQRQLVHDDRPPLRSMGRDTRHRRRAQDGLGSVNASGAVRPHMITTTMHGTPAQACPRGWPGRGGLSATSAWTSGHLASALMDCHHPDGGPMAGEPPGLLHALSRPRWKPPAERRHRRRCGRDTRQGHACRGG